MPFTVQTKQKQISPNNRYETPFFQQETTFARCEQFKGSFTPNESNVKSFFYHDDSQLMQTLPCEQHHYYLRTSMHSSRMRTARSLTVSRSVSIGGEGVCMPCPPTCMSLAMHTPLPRMTPLTHMPPTCHARLH